jgi:hypothetical protein
MNRLPMAFELLALMDAHDPSPYLKYIDILSELDDMGIEDVLAVYTTPTTMLASFGSPSLGPHCANRLKRYAHGRLLVPLGLVDTKGNVITAGAVIEELTDEKVAVKDDSSSVELVVEEEVAVDEDTSSVELVVEEKAAVEEDTSSVELVVKEESVSDDGAELTFTQKTGQPEDSAIVRWLKGLEEVSQVGIEEVDDVSSAFFSDSVRGGVSSQVSVTSWEI